MPRYVSTKKAAKSNVEEMEQTEQIDNQDVINVSAIDVDVDGDPPDSGDVVIEKVATMVEAEVEQEETPVEESQPRVRYATRKKQEMMEMEAGQDVVYEEIDDQEAIDAFNEQLPTNVRLFGFKPIVALNEAATIMHYHTDDPSRICTAVPDGCPRGTQTATYLVDIRHLADPRELHQDKYGKWGNSSGHKGFFRIVEDGQAVAKVNEMEKYDFYIQRLKWIHRDTGSMFNKIIYRYITANSRQLWALVCYEWRCEPFDFTPRSDVLATERRIMPKISRAPGVAISVSAQSVGSLEVEDPELLASLNKEMPEGVVVFSSHPVQLLSDAAIITQFQSVAERTCTVRPQFCPTGARSCSFLVDLSCMAHPRDLACDRYGKWGNSSGHKAFFRVDFERQTVQKVDPALEYWDVLVQRLKYLHPDTDRQLSRTIYWQSDSHGRQELGILSYEWHCKPFEFTPSCHGNAINKNQPYVRTAPSVLENVRQAVTKYRPTDAYQAVMNQSITEGVESGADLPRDITQISNMAKRTPGAVACNRKRRVANVDEMHYSPSPSIGPKQWKDMVRKSKEIAKNGQIAEYPGEDDLYVVMIDRTSNTVHRNGDVEFECTCEDFAQFRHVCAHTIAAAKLENVTQAFMEVARDKYERDQFQGTPSSLKLIRTPTKQARQSGGYSMTPRATPRVGVLRSPSAVSPLSGIPVPTVEELESLRHKKPPTYTQPFHNDRPFMLVFLQDCEIEDNQCQQCQVGFPLMDTVLPPENVAIAHEERVLDEQTGKYGKELKTRLVHARHGCLVARYPYFYVGLLQLTHVTRDKLAPEHKKHLDEQFGVDVDAALSC